MAIRKLAYKDVWMETLQQSLVTGDCPSPPPIIDPVGDNYITLKLTANEITILLSALWQGAQLTYPESVYQTVWLFLQGLECNLLCDAIAATCLTDPAFMAQLTSALMAEGFAQASGGGSDAVQPGLLGASIGDLGAGCTNNERFGLAFKITDLLNNHAVDMLDIIGILATEAEIAGEMVDHAGLLGVVFGSALDVAKYMLDSVVGAYVAAWDLASHDVVACAVYCAMDGGCTLDLETLIEAYASVITVFDPPPTNASFLTIAIWLSTQVVTADDQIVAMYHWLILNVMSHGGSWAQSTPRTLEVAASASLDIPPPAGCDCTEDWTHQFLDGSGLQDWIPVKYSAPFPVSTYDAGNDRVDGKCVTSDGVGVGMQISFPSTVITQIIVSVSFSGNRATSSDRVLIGIDGNLSKFAICNHGTGPGTDVCDTGVISSTETDIELRNFVGVFSCESWYARITKVIVKGEGTNPFI